MATLEDNIKQAIADFDDIEAAIEEKGVDVPYGTDTSEYGNLIRSITTGGGDCHIKYVESLDSENLLNLYEFESGTYILYGRFRPYPNAANTFSFSSGQLVSVRKGSKSTCVQVFYPPYNAIQYLNIWADETLETGYDYERKDAKLYYMEDTRYRVTALDETSDDEHYPTAKAAYDYFVANNAIPLVKSYDEENLVNLRDLETGSYVIDGYFKPFAGSPVTIPCGKALINVEHKTAGSHIICFNALNSVVNFIEILVDETNTYGYTYENTQISLLELNGLIDRVSALETQIGDIETLLGGI